MRGAAIPGRHEGRRRACGALARGASALFAFAFGTWLCHACTTSNGTSDAEQRSSDPPPEPRAPLSDGWDDTERYEDRPLGSDAEHWSEGGAGGEGGEGGEPASTGGEAGSAGALPSPRSAPLRVLPLGDSITGSSCYRAALYDALREAGHDFDFVGSLDSRGDCDHPSYDGDHEGHGGYLVTDLAQQAPPSELTVWCRLNPSDVALVHFGTNDLWNDRPVQAILSAYDAVLSELRANNPKVAVLVAQIVPLAPLGCSECPARSEALNAAIPAWAESRTRHASPVIVVDQQSGFDSATDTDDGVHPNESGSRKMAERWFDALAPLFRE